MTKKRYNLDRLTQEQIDAVIRDYRTPTLSLRDIIRRNTIGKDRIMAIIRANKIPMRGRHSPTFIFKNKPKKVEPHAILSDTALERAKTALRQRGYIVFAAEVTDGPRGKGYFRCDGKLFTRQQVMEAAAR